MNSTRILRRSERPRIPLERRIVTGIITEVGPDYLNLNFSGDHGDCKGRLRKEHADIDFQSRWSDLKQGEDLKVFLLHPNELDLSFWQVSQQWATRASNPWFIDPPTVGQEVAGVVNRYVEDYAVIVVLNNGIKAFLHVKRVPQQEGKDKTPQFSRWRDITEELFIGDRLLGEVIQLDTSRLEVYIDLRPVIVRRRKMALEQRRSLLKEFSDYPEPETDNPDPQLFGIRLWLVDDDPCFRKAMEDWLTYLGAEVQTFCGIKDLRSAAAAIQQPNKLFPTHVLLDRELNQIGEWEACREFIETLPATINVGHCSSHDHYLNSDTSSPGFQKPLDTAALCGWLINGTAPLGKSDINAQVEADPLWLDRALNRDFEHDAKNFLSDICDTSIAAILWAERIRRGVYGIVASHGLNLEEIKRTMPLFEQSLIGDVIERKQNITLIPALLGHLAILAPSKVQRVYGLSLKSWGYEDQVVLFFITISGLTDQTLKRFGPAFTALLIEREALEHLNESRPFAALGRFWSGYAHELRHAIAPVFLETRKLKNWLCEEAGPLSMVPAASLRLEVGRLAETITNLEQTVSYELGKVRRRAQRCVQIKETVIKVIRLARSLSRQERKKMVEHDSSWLEPLVWLSSAPEDDIELALDAQALVQPLLNLLDNAVYNVLSLGEAGLVEVRIKYNLNDSERLPLCIEVKDNGLGVDANQQIRLFRPRTSTRGSTGIGMGLYISERLVRAAGGKLEFVEEESIRFLGAMFRIRLPLRIAIEEKD